MPSIIIKYQKCGKTNCRCSTHKILHGPYFWLVRYIKPRYTHEKGRYKWRYLGKNGKDLATFFNQEGEKYHFQNILQEELEQKFKEYQQELQILKDPSRKSQSRSISLEESQDALTIN